MQIEPKDTPEIFITHAGQLKQLNSAEERNKTKAHLRTIEVCFSESDKVCAQRERTFFVRASL